MSDTLGKAVEAAERIAMLEKERKELLASAEAHEAQAREDRRKATACKNEAGEWATALRTHQAQHHVETAQQAATKARQEAEAHAADAQRIKEEITVELEKVKTLREELERSRQITDLSKTDDK